MNINTPATASSQGPQPPSNELEIHGPPRRHPVLMRAPAITVQFSESPAVPPTAVPLSPARPLSPPQLPLSPSVSLLTSGLHTPRPSKSSRMHLRRNLLSASASHKRTSADGGPRAEFQDFHAVLDGGEREGGTEKGGYIGVWKRNLESENLIARSS